jgi:integrase
MKKQLIRWSKEEIKYLKKNHAHMSSKQLAQQLGRRWASVRNKLHHLNLNAAKSDMFWSKARESKLLRLFKAGKTTPELAMAVGSTQVAIRSKLKHMGVWKQMRPGPRAWTQDEINTILFKCEKYSMKDLCKALDRPYYVVRRKMRQMGVQPLCAMYTIRKASEVTGYDVKQLKRAREGLNQTWRRVNYHRYAISKKQLAILCDYLKHEGEQGYVPPTRIEQLNEDEIDFERYARAA